MATMKKRVINPCYAFLAFLFLFASCEKEKSLKESIVGKWEVKSVRQVTYEDNILISEYTLYAQTQEMAIQFAEGGSGMIFNDGQINGVFTWTLSGNTISLDLGDEVIEWNIDVDDDLIIWSFTETEIIENINYKYEYFYSARKIA